MAEDNVTIKKLSNMSLDVIIENFDRFMEAHVSGSIPARNLEFLQRTQSLALWKKFVKEKTAAKHIKFLLNRFLKDVDLEDCNWDTNTVVNQLLVIGEKIEKLSLFGSQYSCDSLLILSLQLPNLRSLTLFNVQLSKDVLYNIGHSCRHLQILNLFTPRVTNEMIQALCVDKENKILQHLDISMTSITTVGVVFILQHFSNLLFIRHPDVYEALCTMDTDSFENNSFNPAKKYKLKSLELSKETRKYLNERTMKLCQFFCPDIADLFLACIESQLQFDIMTNFNALTKLYVHQLIPVCIDLTAFLEAKGKNLEVLVAKNVVLSSESLVKFCPNLEFLKLTSISFKPLEKSTLGYTFQRLKVLLLVGMYLFKDVVSRSTSLIISSTRSLEKLEFSSSYGIDEDYIKALNVNNSMKTIKELDIIDSAFKPASIELLLSACSNLKKFNLIQSKWFTAYY